jgi:hypothetical protein
MFGTKFEDYKCANILFISHLNFFILNTKAMILDFIFLQSNVLILKYKSGRTQSIQLDNNSGKIVYRRTDDLLGAIFNTKHKGVRLGIDLHTKEEIYIHNHKDEGYAHFTNYSGFAKGLPTYFDSKVCINSPFRVIEIALNYVNYGVKYQLLSENCQILTSNACTNVRKSEDVAKMARFVIGGLAVFFVGALIFSDNTSKR